MAKQKEHKGPTGEWWIIDGKPVLAARNSETGVPGHSEVVMRFIGKQFLAEAAQHPRLASLAMMLEDLITDPDPAGMRTMMCDWADQELRDEKLTDDEADDVYAFVREQLDWSEDKLGILTEHHSDGDDRERDPRFYAVKYLNWIRVEGPTIEVWELTNDNLRRLRCLEECQEIVPADRFTLTVRGGVETFFGLPWIILQESRVEAIRQYVRQFGDTIRISV